MERVILRHLKGSKSGAVEEFPLASVTELTLGRDPMAQVRFDAGQGRLVGRQHARSFATRTIRPASRSPT